jgi:hypothetical protein
LLNLGFALLIMQIVVEINDSRSKLVVPSSKVGGFSIYPGLSLFFHG